MFPSEGKSQLIVASLPPDCTDVRLVNELVRVVGMAPVALEMKNGIYFCSLKGLMWYFEEGGVLL